MTKAFTAPVRPLDETIREFRDCDRCGVQLSPEREGRDCIDCKGLNAYRGNPRQVRNNGTSFPNVDPAYEVSLHYPKIQYNCPTQATLDALQVPYFSYYGTEDPVAVNWAKSLTEGEPEYPIVLISAHGQYAEHWTGFDLARLNSIPAAREAAITTQHEESSAIESEVRVPIREQAA